MMDLCFTYRMYLLIGTNGCVWYQNQISISSQWTQAGNWSTSYLIYHPQDGHNKCTYYNYKNINIIIHNNSIMIMSTQLLIVIRHSGECFYMGSATWMLNYLLLMHYNTFTCKNMVPTHKKHIISNLYAVIAYKICKLKMTELQKEH